VVFLIVVAPADFRWFCRPSWECVSCQRFMNTCRMP